MEIEIDLMDGELDLFRLVFIILGTVLITVIILIEIISMEEDFMVTRGAILMDTIHGAVAMVGEIRITETLGEILTTRGAIHITLGVTHITPGATLTTAGAWEWA